jgi:hypothetical protein
VTPAERRELQLLRRTMQRARLRIVRTLPLVERLAASDRLVAQVLPLLNATLGCAVGMVWALDLVAGDEQ